MPPIADIIVISILILLIPKLVEKHLASLGFRRELRMLIMLGGVLWIAYSCMHELIYHILGIGDADAIVFERYWYGTIVHAIQSHDYGLLVEKLRTPGRSFYVTYQSLFYYYTGGTVTSVLAINSFMAFWGSLTLSRTIYDVSPYFSPRGVVLPFFLIFMPSVVFWSSANLKEALMYWAICQIFAIVAPVKSAKHMRGKLILLFLGAFIGCLLRPHFTFIWMACVFLIKTFQPKFW